MRNTARFETKRGEGSGSGYERWRSYEWRPHTARSGKEDVYVAHHRLLAVVACYPDDMPVSAILEDLDGKDVHHNAPEADGDCGIKWDNRPDCLEVIDHARHAAITQAQMRAWAADEKRERETAHHDEDVCAGCGEPTETLATSPGFEGSRCIECATDAADGAPIEL